MLLHLSSTKQWLKQSALTVNFVAFPEWTRSMVGVWFSRIVTEIRARQRLRVLVVDLTCRYAEGYAFPASETAAIGYAAELVNDYILHWECPYSLL